MGIKFTIFACLALLMLGGGTAVTFPDDALTNGESTGKRGHAGDWVVQLPAEGVLGLLSASLNQSQLPGADRSTAKYVALGDSYSAGTGTFPLSEDQHGCRSLVEFAWPAQVATWLRSQNASNTWVHAACSGYTTQQMQQSRVLANLSNSTKWVTLTAGGNNVGFADVIRQCVLIDESDCLDAVDNSLSKIANLQGELEVLYVDIARAAPNADIYIAGYPDIVPFTNTFECWKRLPFFPWVLVPGAGSLTDRDLEVLRSIIGPLNEKIIAAVKRVNGHRWVQDRFVFVDVRPIFRDHEPCSQFSREGGFLPEWVNGMKPELVDWKLSFEGSFHPNLDGQAAYAQQVQYCMTNRGACESPATAKIEPRLPTTSIE